MTAIFITQAGLACTTAGLFIWGWWGTPLFVFVGLGLFALGVLLPARVQQSTVSTGIDDFLPAFQFGEFHHIRIQAPAALIDRAVREVTPEEMPVAGVLMWLRGIRNRKPGSTVLASALSAGFAMLRDRPGQEMILGTIGCFWRWRGSRMGVGTESFRDACWPDTAKAAMDFRIVEESPGVCLLTTETRVLAADPRSARRFAPYWRLIYPGSSIIRYVWLRAIRKRAEKAAIGV